MGNLISKALSGLNKAVGPAGDLLTSAKSVGYDPFNVKQGAKDLDNAVGGPVQNVARQYDSNVREENKDIEKPKPVGTDYAERIATKAKDYGTRAAAQGVKGTMGSYKKGRKVKKTGAYKLHKNERVLNAKQTKKFEKKGGLAAVLGGK
jgi:hypothetical protein